MRPIPHTVNMLDMLVMIASTVKAVDGCVQGWKAYGESDGSQKSLATMDCAWMSWFDDFDGLCSAQVQGMARREGLVVFPELRDADRVSGCCGATESACGFDSVAVDHSEPQ